MDNDVLSDDDDSLVTHILSENEALVHGLLLADYSQKQINWCSDETHWSRFNSKYGALLAVVCIICEEIQKSNVTTEV